MTAEERRIRQVLLDLRAGTPPDADAFDHMLATLRRLARAYMSRQRPSHMLQTTALLNEAYLRLFDRTDPQWNDASHFFRSAAKVMRHILVDHARSLETQKRKGNVRPDADLQGLPAHRGSDPCHDIVVIDDVLGILAKRDPTLAQIVDLHVFGGRTHGEVAELLGMSLRAVERDWALARACLRKELKNG